MMTEDDKKELMNLDIEDYNINKEEKEIVKQIKNVSEGNNEHAALKLLCLYDCTQPQMSLNMISKKYNLNMKDVIYSYRNELYIYSIPSKINNNLSYQVQYGEIIDYINQNNHTIFDAAEHYNIDIRAVDNIYSKVVHINKQGQYISNEAILTYITNNTIICNDNIRIIQNIADQFHLKQDIISNIIHKVSVLNNKNEYITYFDILNKIDHINNSKEPLQTIANELNLDINILKQIYGRGTVLRGACNTIMRQSIIDYLHNNDTTHAL